MVPIIGESIGSAGVTVVKIAASSNLGVGGSSGKSVP